VEVGGEPRCTRPCSPGCPSGYVCFAGDYCIPESESCSCSEGAHFELACAREAPDGTLCAGAASCRDGVQSECMLSAERCDGADQDCDGDVDEDFLDERGVFSVDDLHCGGCGVDCTTDSDAGLELTCGGDPFAPSCVIACPDAADGVQPGDRLDADRLVATGCECEVSSLEDPVGVAPGDDQLDSNCDGADGEIISGVYVAVGGDDDNPGSPTRPLATIQAGIELARSSLGDDTPRLDVYVASGTYTESLRVPGGMRLHGGYRRDFLSLDPDGFEVVVIAPSDTDAPGGAALVIDEPSMLPTLIQGFSFRGRDAEQPGEPAIGVALLEPRRQVELRDCNVRSGQPADGANGAEGEAGAGPTAEAGAGEPQRAALENAARACIDVGANRVQGGTGGVSRCDGADVSGGAGGSPGCPSFGAPAPGGVGGRGSGGARGGVGGGGGVDMEGPILGGAGSCDSAVCCGLADFRVPAAFSLPEPGRPGDDGAAGAPGAACTDPLGSFDAAGRWQPGGAGAGSAGRPGAGGGGGGSGGGVEMTFVAGSCEFPDGLGGAGGGGGGGGCGGSGGRPGGPGGVAVGVLIVAQDASRLPVLDDVRVRTEPGGDGGDGGTGGDGGPGGSGGFGGAVPEADRSTPPLAGPIPGQRGGKGGDGGAGGGGGGGCGGSSVGIWVTGVGTMPQVGEAYLRDNPVTVGAAGPAGRGGGGVVPGPPGAGGRALEVLVR
jgi:hypothetical protein